MLELLDPIGPKVTITSLTDLDWFDLVRSFSAPKNQFFKVQIRVLFSLSLL